MQPSLFYRLLKLVRLRWGWFILGLAIIPAISVPIITVTGYVASSYAPCLPCHGTGEAAYVLELEIVTEEEQCVEPRQYMTVKHSDLLFEWRDLVEREGITTYVAGDGTEWDISLIDTCLGCHPNRAEFCNLCHSYVGIELGCWDCHTPPEE